MRSNAGRVGACAAAMSAPDPRHRSVAGMSDAEAFMVRAWLGLSMQVHVAARRLADVDWTPLAGPEALARYVRAVVDGANVSHVSNGTHTAPESATPAVPNKARDRDADSTAQPASRPASTECEAEVCVYALGRLQVLRDRAPLVMGRKAPGKCLELLKLLIARCDASGSDGGLAPALWSDGHGSAARGRLKALVHRLRRLLGAGAVVVRDGRVMLAADRCWVDAWECEARLDRLLMPANHGEVDSTLAEVASVLDLYRGPLLDGCDLGAVRLARERLRSKLSRAIARVADDGIAHRRHAQVAGQIDRAIELDPLEERLYQAQMRASLAMGRHAAALRSYANCATTLRATLGVEPSSTIEALRRAARQSAASPNSDATECPISTGVATSTPSHPPTVSVRPDGVPNK